MAESPSELQAEVEKLERKHAENPEGRYFVPLANDYRKMGELERAEALLRAGLQKHPDYLSAHIVLGRCLADRGATSEAADEFTYVLSMDPQNLIALRSLGELAAAEGRRDDAGRWFRELLAVDPMNEDARRALEQLDAQDEAVPEPEPEMAEAGAWWDSGAAAASDPAGTRSGEDSSGELLDIDSPVGSHDRTGPEEHEPEYGMRELRSGDAREDDEEESGDDIEPVEVVTETIAELYARQGLHERAADVYRELIRRRGGDPSLERRLAELEGAAAGPSEAPAADAAAAADDPFAASFADGFVGATPEAPAQDWQAEEEPAEQEAFSGGDADQAEEPAEREAFSGAWAAEADEPEEQESAAGEWATDIAEPRSERAPAGGDAPGDEGVAAQPVRTGGRTIGSYLSSLAAWSPAAGAGSERPVEIGDEEVSEIEASPALDTVDAGEEAADPFPWEVPAGVESPAGSDRDAADEHVRESDTDPWAAADSEPVAEESADPWAATESEPVREAAAEPSWESGASVEPDSAAGAGPERSGGGDSTAAQDGEPEPTIELEDYFPADEPEELPDPSEAASPPPAGPAATSAAEEDDDLESFQAWLRSLKR